MKVETVLKLFDKAIAENFISEPEAIFLYEGKWLNYKWGCDTLQYLRDSFEKELKIAQKLET